MRIVGASFDTPEENQAWAVDQAFLFELWSDADRTLAMYYGAATSPTQVQASRRTVVLDEAGRLCLEYGSVGVSTHPQEVLDDVTLLLSSG